jgi:hypothetical protein
MTRKLLLLLVAGLCASAFTLASAKELANPVPVAKGPGTPDGHWLGRPAAPAPLVRPPIPPASPAAVPRSGKDRPASQVQAPNLDKMRELTELRTANSRTFDNGDGTRTVALSLRADRPTPEPEPFATANVYPQDGNYWTGYVDVSNNKTDGDVHYQMPYPSTVDDVAWVKWDLAGSGIPGNSTITDATFSWDVYDFYAPCGCTMWEICALTSDPVSADGATIQSEFQAQSYVVNPYQYIYGSGWASYSLNANGIGVLNNGLIDGWAAFAIGLNMCRSCYGAYNTAYGHGGGGNMPYLYVTYTVGYDDDVSCTGIPSPMGDTTTYVPSATIRNKGINNAPSFDAHFYATGPGPTYDNTIYGLHLRAGADSTITFPSWHITDRGAWAMQCSTSYSSDMNGANDKYSTNRMIGPTYIPNVLHDVSGLNMYGPNNWDGYAAGYYFTPQVNGQIVALARYRGSYRGDSSSVSLWRVSDQALLSRTTVGDSGWGCVSIVPVSVSAGTQYCVSTYGGVDYYYGYPPYLPYTVNNVTIDAGWYEYGSGDVMPDMYNGGTFIMGVPDVHYVEVHYDYDMAVRSIPSPKGDTGTYTPQALVHNWGNLDASSFDVHFLATGPGPTYDNTITGLHLRSGADSTINFPSWHITDRGYWTMSCSTAFASDMDNSNDKYTSVRNIMIATNVLKDVTGGTMYNGAGYNGYCGGYYFTPQLNGIIDALGRYRDGYSGDASSLSLWRVSDQALLAQVDCSDSGWGVVPISPVSVNAGTQYCVSTYGGNYWSYFYPPSLPYTVNDVRIDAGWYEYGSGNVMPDMYNGGTFIMGAPDVHFTIVHHDYDLACTGIPSPQGDTGTYTPSAKIKNYGDLDASSFSARFLATGPGTTYDQTISGLDLATGRDTTVSFPDWHITDRGAWAMSCSTQFSSDQDNTNDKYSVNRYITLCTNVLKNVTGGTMYNGNGWGGYSMGYYFTAQADGRIMALGRYRDGYASDSSTIKLWQVSNGALLATKGCNDTGWGARRITPVNVYNGVQYCVSTYGGTYVSYYAAASLPNTQSNCRIDQGSYYSGDGMPNNNCGTTIYGAPDVFMGPTLATDAGVTAILAPVGNVRYDSVIAPQATVRNGGTSTVDIPARFKIQGGYEAVATAYGVTPGNSATITFADWTASPGGALAVQCSTELSGDLDVSNNKLTGSVTVTPAYFDLSTPTNGETEVAQSGNLTWNAADGATQHDIYFGKNDPPSLWHANVGNVQTYPYSGLGRDTTYYWYVVAKNSAGNTTCNARFHFTTVQGVDVGARSVTVPAAVDSGATVTPTAVVRNYGTRLATFDVALTFNGLAGYAPVVTVTDLSLEKDTTIAFPTTPPLTDRLGYAVKCTTQLTGDRNPTNDTAGGHVAVVVRDAGTVTFGVPTEVDSGTRVTPTVTVRNYGTQLASFNVTVNIGGAFYTRTVSVSGLSMGVDTVITFPQTNPLIRRSGYAAKCTTQLADDMIQANDRQGWTIAVNIRDVAAVAIVAPSGAIPPGLVTPQASFRNNGTIRDAIMLFYGINCTPPYAESIALAGGIPLGVDTTISFPDWTAVPGSYLARCSVYAVSDLVRANDAASAAFQCGRADVEVSSITAPTGGYDSTVDITPAAMCRNNGEVPANFDVYFIIDSVGGNVYNGHVALTGVAPGVAVPAVFTLWPKPHNITSYTTRCSTYMAGDGDPSNDVKTGSFTIQAHPVNPPGWNALEPLPLGAKSKNVKDGGALAAGQEVTDIDSGYVYAFKGNNRYEFYRYNTTDGHWIPRESIPAIGSTSKKKAVKKGSSLVMATNGKIYGTKGNGTLEWWMFDPAANHWTEKSRVPAGAKTLKEGTSTAAVQVGGVDYVYLLRGSGTWDFYRYNVGTDAWDSSLPPAPSGASGKSYKNGSSITCDGNDTIYCLKGSYNEFAAYSISGKIWQTRDPVPLVGPLGKKKKVKAGGSLASDRASVVWALKGGNTNEFWQYHTTDHKWYTAAPVPTGAKNVNGGGALVYSPVTRMLYAFRGNNQRDFFLFNPFTMMFATEAKNQGVMGGGVQANLTYKLAVSPNPFSGAACISYSLARPGDISLKLYDISGKLVTVLARGYAESGCYTTGIDARKLSHGIYLLKFESEGYTSTAKLILE